MDKKIETMLVAEIAKLLNIQMRSAARLKSGSTVNVPMDAEKLNMILDKF